MSSQQKYKKAIENGESKYLPIPSYPYLTDMKDLKDIKTISNWRGRLADVPFWDKELLRRGGGLAEWMMSPHMEKCDTLNGLLLGLWPSLRIGEFFFFF